MKNSEEGRNKVQRGCVLEKEDGEGEREKERERDAVPRRELKREGSEAREKLSNVARVWNDSRSVPAFSKFSKSLPVCAFERLSSHYFSLARPSPLGLVVLRGISFKATKARATRSSPWILLPEPFFPEFIDLLPMARNGRNCRAIEDFPLEFDKRTRN